MTRRKGMNLLEFSFVLQLSTAYSNASNLIDMFLLKAFALQLKLELHKGAFGKSRPPFSLALNSLLLKSRYSVAIHYLFSKCLSKVVNFHSMYHIGSFLL
jgi:hypothetical protein